MNKRTPVPGYRLLPSLSTKLKLKDNHYEAPCMIQEEKEDNENNENNNDNGRLTHGNYMSRGFDSLYYSSSHSLVAWSF